MQEKKIFTVAILGCGARGADVYGSMLFKMGDRFSIVALCEKNEERLGLCREHFGIDEKNCFNDEEPFFAEKRADLLIVATQDADHVRQGIRGLSLGYDILMEKPIATSKEECFRLLDAQKRYGGKMLVCHVLRYAPAFVKAAEVIDSGAIGRLVEIHDIEQVLYWHQAHSFVRGNWRRSEDGTPMIVAKCCHDLDLIQFYAKSQCKSVSSVGELTFFKEDNAPEGSADRCTKCKYIDTCPYSAKAIYLDRFEKGNEFNWPATILSLKRPLTREIIWDAIEKGPYGRCVFRCDNDVVDHETTVMTFENGVKASLQMSGFTAHGGRKIIFRGTLGELFLDEETKEVRLCVFGGEETKWDIRAMVEKGYNHGGGDRRLMDSLYDMLSGSQSVQTSLAASLESHLMGFAAEESRKEGGALRFVHPEKLAD